MLVDEFLGPLPDVGGVGARVFEGDPGYGSILPTCRRGSVLPVAKEIQIVFRVVVRRVEESSSGATGRLKSWCFG